MSVRLSFRFASFAHLPASRVSVHVQKRKMWGLWHIVAVMPLRVCPGPVCLLMSTVTE